MGEICAGLLFVQYFIRSRGMEHKHTHIVWHEHIHKCIQMGHFHWLGGGSSTSGSHGFHSDIFLDRASSHSACTQDRTIQLLGFLLWERTIFPDDGRNSSLTLMLFHLLFNVCQCGSSSVLSNSSFTIGNRFTWTQLLIAWAQHPSSLFFFLLRN